MNRNTPKAFEDNNVIETNEQEAKTPGKNYEKIHQNLEAAREQDDKGNPEIMASIEADMEKAYESPDEKNAMNEIVRVSKKMNLKKYNDNVDNEALAHNFDISKFADSQYI